MKTGASQGRDGRERFASRGEKVPGTLIPQRPRSRFPPGKNDGLCRVCHKAALEIWSLDQAFGNVSASG